jgi:hypothetical protein
LHEVALQKASAMASALDRLLEQMRVSGPVRRVSSNLQGRAVGGGEFLIISARSSFVVVFFHDRFEQ